jgi:hypothetical protein
MARRADDVTTHPTQDEATAAALRESVAGDQVVVHEAECASKEARSSEEAEARCTCEPLVLTVGATA